MTFKSQPHHVIEPHKHEGPPSCLFGAAACGLKVAKVQRQLVSPEEPGWTRDPRPGGGQVSGNRRADTCKVRPLRRWGVGVVLPNCCNHNWVTSGAGNGRTAAGTKASSRHQAETWPRDQPRDVSKHGANSRAPNFELKTAQKSPDELHLSAKASKKNPTQTLTSCLRCGDGQRYHVGNLF